ncbi:hypothetical protein ACOMHN_028338 [Nucella lapillus]
MLGREGGVAHCRLQGGVCGFRRLMGSKVTLQGNMDPVNMFASKEEIRRGVKEMVDKFGTQRYIANLGHGVMKDTDPDHLGEFISAVHRYSEDVNTSA